jgi:hypothetical protein
MDDEQGWAGKWFVHRYTLTEGIDKGVLRVPVSTLTLQAVRDYFAATFDLLRGPVRFLLTPQPHSRPPEAFYGAGSIDDEPYHGRIVLVDDPTLGLKALVGHVSRQDDHTVRDLFVATRQERPRRPEVKKPYRFDTGLTIPLQDCEPHGKAGIRELSDHHLLIDADRYGIKLADHDTGGLGFRTVVEDNVHSVGGLVLPLDNASQHLVVVCFRHRHAHGSHPTDPVGDVPGHPMCTAVHAAYSIY